MFLLRQYQRQIDQFICSRSRRAFLIAIGLLTTAVGSIGVLVFVIGAPAMNGFAGDVPILLDGAWRIANGQVPHRDFYNFLGDLPFYVTFLGMKIGRPCVSAIDYGNVVLMGAVSLAAIVLLCRRTTALCTFLFSLFIALLVVTPRSLGSPYDYTDHAMLYNRYGEAFVMLLGIVLFLPRKAGTAGRIWPWVEAVFAGLLLVAALGSKMNYFAVGIGFVVAACAFGRMKPAHLLVCLLSAGAFLALALALTKIPFSALLHDYRIMAGVQSFSAKMRGVAVQGIKNILCLPVLFLLVWETYQGQREGQGPRPQLWPHFFVITVIFGAAILLLATNAQIGEVPLLAFAALYGFEVLLSQPAPAETPVFHSARHLGALLLVLLFLLPSLVTSLKTLRFAAYAALGRRSVSTATIQSTRLNDFRFVFEGTRKMEMKDFMDSFDDGVQLLRRHLASETPVNIIVFANPFQIALGWLPPRGGSLCVAKEGINRKSHPSLTRLLGDAPYIVTPHGCLELKDIYGSAWEDLHLPVIEDTKYYTLFAVPKSLSIPSE
ncbi:MAG TPA: hypothetical protein VFC44_11210 [Candidatus Saccharimonadales bacterium]|nr:hypothetical protein [Candidatus Saccharimonadales bacterium]